MAISKINPNSLGGVPAFGAWQSTQQTLSSVTNTKIQLQTEEFDTNNCFDSTTNYRFTPTVAGYYQFNAAIAVGASVTPIMVMFFKNGTMHKQSNLNTAAVSAGTLSSIIYLNGSTDYVELYGWVATGQGLNYSSTATWFNGVLVRTA